MSSTKSMRDLRATGPVSDDGVQQELNSGSVEHDVDRVKHALEVMLEADRLLRGNDVAGLRALGFSDEHIADLKGRATDEDAGYPKFAMNAARRHLRFVRSTLNRQGPLS